MKELKLPGNYITLLDDEDYDRLKNFAWYTSKGRRGSCYVMRSELGHRHGKKILLHREILQAKKDQVVDHKDFNGLNNQKENLRVCSYLSNNQHRRKGEKETSSRFKGVYWEKDKKKWRAQIRIKGKNKKLGRFKLEEEAARVYDKAAEDAFGEFASCNFPSK